MQKKQNPCLDELINNFCNINRNYWIESPKEEVTIGSGSILVEGFLSQYGPNYAFRTGLVAKALSEKYDLDVFILFRGKKRNWEIGERLYSSFGFNQYIFSSELSIIELTKNLIGALNSSTSLFFRIKYPGDISKIKFNDLLVGDLIYDDYLKFGPEKTIEKKDLKLFILLVRARFLYYQYDALFKKTKYKFYVASHVQYSTYGLACRVALKNNCKVVETTDIKVTLYKNISDQNLPNYSQGIRNSIYSEYPNDLQALAIMREVAKNKLKKRMLKEVDQMDVKNAYSGLIYTKKELLSYYKFNNPKFQKIVFILAHIFSDAPHSGNFTLYEDYYQWLNSTLKIIQKNKEVLWVVKPHPSSRIYKEEGLISSMIAELSVDNIRECPADLNVSSLVNTADSIITVYGTAGLEFSCLGVPVVLAGRPFYSEAGFTVDPNSIGEYEEILLNIQNMTRLTSNQVDKACEIYALWDDLHDWNNPIISTEVLEEVWGNNGSINLNAAYSLINENLKINKPKDLRLWNYCQKHL